MSIGAPNHFVETGWPGSCPDFAFSIEPLRYGVTAGFYDKMHMTWKGKIHRIFIIDQAGLVIDLMPYKVPDELGFYPLRGPVYGPSIRNYADRQIPGRPHVGTSQFFAV